MDQRQQQILDWIATDTHLRNVELKPITGDASFRRYFRLVTPNHSYIVMDAPPELENCEPFVAIARGLQMANVMVPWVINANLEQGFLVLSDFGDRSLLSALNAETVDKYYRQAMQTLLTLQRCRDLPDWTLPTFDREFMLMELDRFRHWYLELHCQRKMVGHLATEWDRLVDVVLAEIVEQPHVMIHRDYHSRNLMVTHDGQLGVLDFQDAMWGPVTYDLVSLLKDCYITWPAGQVVVWALTHKNHLKEAGLIGDVDNDTFLRWFDFMGVQRHLKCIGIFARLAHRDNKTGYLLDIPRVASYLDQVANRYPELSSLPQFLFEVR